MYKQLTPQEKNVFANYIKAFSVNKLQAKHVNPIFDIYDRIGLAGVSENYSDEFRKSPEESKISRSKVGLLTQLIESTIMEHEMDAILKECNIRIE